ncbi:PiggyBac transposable element-derived protein 4, partial [Geodia barretti]
MGLVNLPTIEDHWVTTWPYSSEACSKVLSRDRFSLIMKFLHLSDNSQYIPRGQPGHDPLYKIRPLLSPLLANFKAAYTLHRELSIDEAMVGFKGRLCFIQYLPKKPTKWGIKAYVLADSATGYVYSWRLYTGNLLLLI